MAQFNDLRINKSGTSYVMRATAPSLGFFRTSTAFSITAGPTTQLVFTGQPSNAVAGASIAPPIVVSAQDVFFNTTTFGGSVTLTIATNPGVPPGTLTGGGPVTALNGVATFSGVSINKTGVGYTLRAGSGTLTPDTSVAFTITPGPVTHLTFVVQPATTAAGSPITPAVQVAARDANENTVTSFTSNVTMAIGTNPPGNGILSGTLTVPAEAGVAAFSNLNIDKVGTGYTLTATSAPFAATSTPFNIITSPISNTLSTVVATSPITACAVGCSTVGGTASLITVTARDGSGNAVQGATVVLSATGTGNTLTQPATTTNASGVATGTLSSTSTIDAKIVSAVIGGVAILDTDTVTVNPGPAASLAFTPEPGTTTAGVAINSGSGGVVVTARDQFDNTATSFGSLLTMVLGANPAGGALSGTLTATPTAGVATFQDLRITKAGTGYRLQASGGALTSPLSSAFTITTAPVSKLAFIVQPVTTADSAPITPAVQVAGQDSVGNTVTTFTGLVRMFIDNPGTNPGGGTLSGTTQVNATAGTGVATFSNLRINALGTGYTLLTTSSGLTDDVSAPFDIIPGPAVALFFTVEPSQTVAGSAISPAVQVTARDNQGNTATSFFGNVTLTIGTNPAGNGILTGGGPLAASAGIVSFPAASIDKAGSPYTLLANATGLTGATSIGFNVISGGVSPTLSTITRAPTSITASSGTITSTITVTARDNLNNAIQGATVVLSATGSGNSLIQPVATTNASGVATGTLASTVAETKTVSATIDGTLINATTTVGVNPAAPKLLLFNVHPNTTVATQTIRPATGVQVEVRDTFNNRVTGANISVNIAILNNPATPPGTLSGTTTATQANGRLVGGIATFNDLSIDKVGTGYTLLTSSTGLVSDTSVGFTITVGAATKLGFVQQPTSTSGGATISPAITVEILDAGNNRVNSTATVTLAIGTNPGPNAALSGTASLAAVAGLATFSNLSIDSAGTGYTLVATSGALTQATSGAFNNTVGAATKLGFRVQPSNTAGGATITPAIEVEVRDAGGNRVTSASNLVDVAILNNAGGGTLAGDNSNNAVSGLATFNTLSINSAGTGYTLQATATGLTSAVSAGFNIAVGGATKLGFVQQPSNATGGATISPAVTVEIQDAGGNRVTGATNSVALAIGVNPGPGAALTGGNAVPAVNGLATFSNLSIDSAGTGYTLVATSGALTQATSTSFNITVGAATKLGFRVPPSNTAGGAVIAPAIEVEVQDAGGNRVTGGAPHTVDIAILNNPSTGVLTGDASNNTSGGVATFADLSIDVAANGYTLRATSTGLTSVTSTGFTIVVGAPAKLAFFQQPTNEIAGVSIAPAITVRVLDAGNNLVTTATNPVDVAILNNAGPGGTLSGDASNNASGGVATFTDLSIDKSGTGYTLRATSGSLTAVTSTGFDISHASADHLVFTVQPLNTQSGQTITPAVKVEIRDAFENLVTNATDDVTLAITNGTGTPLAQLSGTIPIAAVGGIATFSDLSIDLVGTGYTLDATAAGMSAATSDPFDITL
ncbi:MAG: beta strand repeat-containing protein [Gemmatimonadales bacterium]